MKFYESSVTINATPDHIWNILTDAQGMTEWDSGVVSVEGSIAAGEKIKVTSEASPGRAFPVTVTNFEPGKTMTWSGGMPMGLFKGVRTFHLTPTPAGAVDFQMREEYSGLMLPLMWRMMPDLQPSFDKFAAGLKAKAEAAE